MPNYACIKDGVVVNTLVFNEEDSDLREQMRVDFDYDLIILLTNDAIITGDLYVDSEFVLNHEIADPNAQEASADASVDPSEFPEG